MPRTYPVSLVLDNQAILVVGGGAVATRKVEGLLPYPVSITIVAPHLSDTLQNLVKDAHCTWRAKDYDASDLQQVDIVFVATDDESVNRQVYADASRLHLMINVADRPELCSFFLPSVLRRGKLSIAVSTEGSSPLSARKLRDGCAALIPEHFEDYLEMLGAWRPRVIAALPDEHERYLFWQQATDGRACAFVEHDDLPAAEALLDKLLKDLCASS